MGVRDWSAAVLASLCALAAGTFAAADAPPEPSPFKVAFQRFDAGAKPLEAGEILFWHGRAYVFDLADRHEVAVFEPSNPRLELLDIKRMIQTELTQTQLELASARRRRTMLSAIARQERDGGKANLIAASISRDLVDPKFECAFDPDARRLRLKNAHVEVVATGVPVADPARLRLFADTLRILAHLDSFREENVVPPFPMLATLDQLVRDHQLAPREVTFLFEVAGPPEKVRWTYDLTPALTDREVGVLEKIGLLRQRAANVRFDRYDRRGDD
ncbi:MAG: hypothetical protein KGM43_17040 [Planctomycetota bacterium]|nr:hypothetical protein [Planctomycetota bacterium]